MINAVIESDRIEAEGALDHVMTPSESGKGQEIIRCPACRVALWSHYPTAGRRSSFVRVGTLDAPDRYPPDVHIFTRSKQPWVILPADAKVFPDFYPSTEGVWTTDARRRWQTMMAG